MSFAITLYGARLGRSPFTLFRNYAWAWSPLGLGRQTRPYAKKAKKSAHAAVELVEGEEDVINMSKVDGSMLAAVNSLKHEYATTVTARITPASLDKISVEIEGQTYPLKQIAQLGMPNPQTLLVNMSAYPECVNTVQAAIRAANLNLNPLVEKTHLKIPIPKMTGELRESLAKLAKSHAEKAKVGVRKARQKGTADLKKKTSGSISEDTVHRLEKYLQQMADRHIASIEEMLTAKSAELIKSR